MKIHCPIMFWTSLLYTSAHYKTVIMRDIIYKKTVFFKKAHISGADVDSSVDVWYYKNKLLF